MDPLTIGILGIILFLVLLILGVHIAVSLGIVGLLGVAILKTPVAAFANLASLSYSKVSNFTLVVIPLFIFMGILASEAGIVDRAFEALKMWAGKLRGSLAIAVSAGCTIFGTLCGSSMVTAALFAKITVPQMRREGYDKKFSYGLCAAAGNIGMLIPPSVLLVVWGITSGDSIGKMLIGGITPGILTFVVLSVGAVIWAYLDPKVAPAVSVNVTWLQRFASLIALWPFVVMMVIIIGGIFSGFWTSEEAAAVGCLFLLIVFIAKRQPWRKLKSAMVETVITTAMVFLLFVGAGIFTTFLNVSGVSDALLNAVVQSGVSTIPFLIASCIAYLILGCFLDMNSIILITIPVLLPVVKTLGIDTIYFGIVSIYAIILGTLTPPVGMNVFGVKAVAEPDTSLEEIFQGAMPFLAMSVVILVILIAFPSVCTFLPNLMVTR